MKKQIFFLVLLAFFLNACSSAHLAVTEHYELPKSFENSNINLVEKEWWKHFELEELNKLVKVALENNSDIIMVLQKIEQAKLELNIANSSFFPNIDISSNTSSSKRKIGNENYNNSESSNASLGINYEVDLWGKIRASSSIAQASLNINRYDFETIRLTLISTLIETYFQYIATSEKIDLTLSTFEDEKSTLVIMKKKYELGSINALDLSQQKSSLLGFQSTLETLQLEKQTLHNSLALLLGITSAQLQLKENSFEYITIPKVSENLSSSILLNRPDVARAKEQIKSSNASIHRAYTSLFPSFSLTGSAGQSSADLLSLSNPTTLLSLGLGLNFNLFDNGSLKNQVKIEQSKTYESVENYKKVLLTALREVENSLNTVHSNKIQNELKKSILEQENKTLFLSDIQYNYGLIDYTALLNAKRAYTQAKESLVNQKLSYLSSLVTLQKALSGSWVRYKN